MSEIAPRACRMPRVTLVAWSERGPSRFIFVAVPNEHGRYVRTDASVAHVPCPLCNSTVGEPCKSKRGKYHSGTHARRRDLYQQLKRSAKHGIDLEPVDVIDVNDGAHVSIKKDAP